MRVELKPTRVSLHALKGTRMTRTRTSVCAVVPLAFHLVSAFRVPRLSSFPVHGRQATSPLKTLSLGIHMSAAVSATDPYAQLHPPTAKAGDRLSQVNTASSTMSARNQRCETGFLAGRHTCAVRVFGCAGSKLRCHRCPHGPVRRKGTRRVKCKPTASHIFCFACTLSSPAKLKCGSFAF